MDVGETVECQREVLKRLLDNASREMENERRNMQAYQMNVDVGNAVVRCLEGMTRMIVLNDQKLDTIFDQSDGLKLPVLMAAVINQEHEQVKTNQLKAVQESVDVVVSQMQQNMQVALQGMPAHEVARHKARQNRALSSKLWADMQSRLIRVIQLSRKFQSLQERHDEGVSQVDRLTKLLEAEMLKREKAKQKQLEDEKKRCEAEEKAIVEECTAKIKASNIVSSVNQALFSTPSTNTTGAATMTKSRLASILSKKKQDPVQFLVPTPARSHLPGTAVLGNHKSPLDPRIRRTDLSVVEFSSATMNIQDHVENRPDATWPESDVAQCQTSSSHSATDKQAPVSNGTFSAITLSNEPAYITGTVRSNPVTDKCTEMFIPDKLMRLSPTTSGADAAMPSPHPSISTDRTPVEIRTPTVTGKTKRSLGLLKLLGTSQRLQVLNNLGTTTSGENMKINRPGLGSERFPQGPAGLGCPITKITTGNEDRFVGNEKEGQVNCSNEPEIENSQDQEPPLGGLGKTKESCETVQHPMQSDHAVDMPVKEQGSVDHAGVDSSHYADVSALSVDLRTTTGQTHHGEPMYCSEESTKPSDQDNGIEAIADSTSAVGSSPDSHPNMHNNETKNLTSADLVTCTAVGIANQSDPVPPPRPIYRVPSTCRLNNMSFTAASHRSDIRVGAVNTNNDGDKTTTRLPAEDYHATASGLKRKLASDIISPGNVSDEAGCTATKRVQANEPVKVQGNDDRRPLAYLSRMPKFRLPPSNTGSSLIKIQRPYTAPIVTTVHRPEHTGTISDRAQPVNAAVQKHEVFSPARSELSLSSSIYTMNSLDLLTSSSSRASVANESDIAVPISALSTNARRPIVEVHMPLQTTPDKQGNSDIGFLQTFVSVGSNDSPAPNVTSMTATRFVLDDCSDDPLGMFGDGSDDDDEDSAAQCNFSFNMKI